MRVNRVIAVSAVLAATGLSGCHSASQALGLTKVTPDEFRVVAKAPLVVPPDYALRPPAPGEPRPQELQPESAARSALIGQREAEARSDGEKLLASKAGADRADPLIRYVVDDDGAVAHKEKGFADRVLFWRSDKTAHAQEVPAPVDAASEAERIGKLTGGQTVTISKEESRRFKLPGL